MSWNVFSGSKYFSGIKYYGLAGIALVGLSAASTLLTDRVSLAQQPTTVENQADEFDVVFKALTEKLGDDHPEVKKVRERLEQSRDRQREAARRLAEVRSKVDGIQRIKVGNPSDSEITVTGGTSANGEVVTENVIGNQSIVVRRTADGNEVHEVLAVQPVNNIRGFRLFGDSQQNSDLQKAVEKFSSKETSDADKTAEKEKIVSILGQQFDDDMQQRSQQIAELEKKVATLKEQVEKRKGAKTRMVELRLEMLMNESEGLGFPSSWQQPAGVGSLSSPLFPGREPARVLRGLSAPVPPAPPAPPAPPQLGR